MSLFYLSYSELYKNRHLIYIETALPIPYFPFISICITGIILLKCNHLLILFYLRVFALIISKKYLKRYTYKHEFTIDSRDRKVCPLCCGSLFVRGSRRRKVKEVDGKVAIYRLKRFKCKKCGKMHTEIPDCIIPYKRYSAEVIETELTGGSNQSCPAEKSTIRRWKKFLNSVTSMLKTKAKSSHKTHWLAKLCFWAKTKVRRIFLYAKLMYT